ncbi:MAG: glycoside hydrolase domain-containing protein [Mangrovibacterium sp.]
MKSDFKVILSLICAFYISLSVYGKGVELSFSEAKYGIAKWEFETYGNYRAVIEVEENSDAAYIRLPWRRRDARPQYKRIIIIDASTNRQVDNIYCPEINREYGDIVFKPATVPGKYYIYYMPYNINHSYFPNTVYLIPEDRANRYWKISLPLNKLNTLSKAQLIEFQAKDDFYNVFPMEVIATKDETQRLINTSENSDYLLFPEEREYPIVMRNDLPLRWIIKGPGDEFLGKGQPGEYYTFQIGYYALRDIDDIDVVFECENVDNKLFTCFNTNGVDWAGKRFSKNLSVKKNHVQPLWCGIQIPLDFKGMLLCKAKIKPLGLKESTVAIRIDVSGEPLTDGGVGDIKKMSRMKWLNSDIGLDDNVFGIYTPVSFKNNKAGILGREIILDKSGLPRQLTSMFDDMSAAMNGPKRELLSSPVRLLIEENGDQVDFKFSKHEVIHRSTGALVLKTRGKSPRLDMECRSKIECDGYANFTIRITAKENCSLSDIRLEIPYKKEIATYMMGMGCKGGFRPEKWDWKWDINSSNSVFWIGTVGAGLQCRLKGYKDIWELFNFKDTGIPEDWYNSGKGGCTMREERNSFIAKAYSGSREIKEGDTLMFRFGLLLTPVKPLDQDHWQWRYWHSNKGINMPDSVNNSNASIINIHHATGLNPYINYPFVTSDTLKSYVSEEHSHDKKVKLYYTVRELSVRAPEIFALRSLGNEIFRSGKGFRLADRFTRPTETDGITGESWLCEHLLDDYLPAWHHYFDDGTWDAAIAQTGLSRWHNYYLEGLNWLIKKARIDGIYLDGLGYDREIMKRVRKVMDRSRPGCLIDFHCGNHFLPQYGMNNISNFFMEHFPYINSLWLGEGFDYNESPDYWLTEIAGIPYGLYGEMLEGGGNAWRGMVYGMTNRLKWGGNPAAIWKLWDDFGISESQMLGYWSKRCPAKINDDEIKATAYVKKDKTLIAVGNWGDNKTIELNIDWKAIGIHKSGARIIAPPIDGIQNKTIFKPDEPIPVEANKGWFLILSE